MAESSTGPLAGIVNMLMANPALLQTALSLFSGEGGSSSGLNLGSILNLVGGKAPSAVSSAEPSAKEEEVPFDLEAFLAKLPKTDAAESKAEPIDTTKQPDNEKTTAVFLPTAKESEGRHQGGLRSDAALLLALRPYLNVNRRAMIDNIVRVSRLMDSFRHFNSKDGSL